MLEDNIDLVLNEINSMQQTYTCEEINSEIIQNDINQDCILNLNIRGLQNNLMALEEFLDDFDNLSFVKIIGITEIFNADSKEKNNYLSTHTLTSTCRSDNINRGGIGFLVSNEIQFSEVEIEEDFREGLFESKTILVPAMKSLFTCVYRPNAHTNSNTTNFILSLEQHMDRLKRIPEYNSHTSYYMGDFNINLNHPTERHT
jgi:exonuclease III